MSDTAETTGAASGGVRTLLRLEGLALFTGMTLLYGVWDGSWWVYAILFVAPGIFRDVALPVPRQRQPPTGRPKEVSGQVQDEDPEQNFSPRVLAGSLSQQPL